MNIQNILFPMDFSTDNGAALEYASRLAAESGARLHVVHVHDTRDIGLAMGEASFVYAEKWEEERCEAEKRLKKVVPTVPTVKCAYQSLLGMPDAEIVAYAADHNIDLIVMASHGRSGLSRLLMGSVAEGVLRKASCPVLIVKQPQAKPTTKEAKPVPAVAQEH